MLFVVGGNGGNAGAAAIQKECDRCGVLCSVVAVPKSIDNDLVSRFFRHGLLCNALSWAARPPKECIVSNASRPAHALQLLIDKTFGFETAGNEGLLLVAGQWRVSASLQVLNTFQACP